MKDRRVYIATTTAIDEFGKENGVNGREYIAQKIGLMGENADKQLSQILNTTSYNPVRPKRMTIDQFIDIAYSLDDKGALTMLNALAGELGYIVTKESNSVNTKTSEIEPLLEAFMVASEHHGHVSTAILDAIKDGELDAKEQKKLIKVIIKYHSSISKALEVLS